MNIIVFASRKGGSGKSTLAAHISAQASKSVGPCLLIDADPQGSVTLWHKLRRSTQPALRSGARGILDVVKAAKNDGYQWTFIDTPPNMSAVVTDAIGSATLLVVPARLALFDLAAIRETIDLARQYRTPDVVVINAAPAGGDSVEAAFVSGIREANARLSVPVWAGQITNRADYAHALVSGQGANEFDAKSQAAGEVARLWSAIERSVKAIQGHYRNARAMHYVAA